MESGKICLYKNLRRNLKKTNDVESHTLVCDCTQVHYSRCSGVKQNVKIMRHRHVTVFKVSKQSVKWLRQ
jgi:hypothetical protein